MENVVKDSNNKRSLIVILIISIIVISLVGTYAWFTWNSTNNTELTLTIGELADVTFNTGNDINVENIGPVLDYTKDGEITTFSLKNKSELELLTNINLNISNLPEELKEESFKYVLLSSNDNNIFTEVVSGNFKDKSNGVLSLLKDEPTKVGTTYYKFIIYIDGNMENPIDMMGKSFSAKIEVEVAEDLTGAEYIESLLPENLTTMNNDDPDGNVRYMGKNPNNYVKFNNELWRIIGVFDVVSIDGGTSEKRLKIIRDELLGDMAWDSGNVNDWSKASLQNYLNGEYYNSLTLEFQRMIGNTMWNLGGWNTSKVYAYELYKYERGMTVYNGRSTQWTGNIALMYPSDYLYSSDLEKCTNTADWWDLSGCASTSWILSGKYEWFITPSSADSYGVFGVNMNGGIGNLNNVSYSNSFRPTLYLKSTVQIIGGIGTSSNPFLLANQAS